MREHRFLSRLENLRFQGIDTGYRYLGSMESCCNLVLLTTKEGKSKIMTNLLLSGNEEFMAIHEVCDVCEDKDDCEIKDKSFDSLQDCEEFGNIEKDIMQELVYYNENLNSAVVFVVSADSIVENYGFINVIDLIDDIYSGVNSPYAVINEDLKFENSITKKLKEGLTEKDNLIYIEYLNSDTVFNRVDIHYRNLKDVKVRGLLDILNLVQ